MWLPPSSAELFEQFACLQAVCTLSRVVSAALVDDSAFVLSMGVVVCVVFLCVGVVLCACGVDAGSLLASLCGCSEAIFSPSIVIGVSYWVFSQ